MIYLASPYSNPEPAVREERFQAACAATAALVRAGHQVYSPIVHGHPLTQHHVAGDWRFWERHAYWHLERCDEIFVLMLDGWETSQGVQAEIEIAENLGKLISYRRTDPSATPTSASVA
jgi:hypothetical protein